MTLFTIWEIVQNDMIYNINQLDREKYREEIILDALIISLVAVKLIMRGCCKEKVGFGALILWCVLEVIIVQILCFINI